MTTCGRVLCLVASVLLAGCTAEISGNLGQAGTGPTQPTPNTPTNACDTTPTLAKPRIWRMTNSQLARTLRDQFGVEPAALVNLPTDARLDGFANQASQLTIAPLLAEVYYAIGEQLGEAAVQSPGKFDIACDVASLGPGACLDGFLAKTGRKLWRRPLSPSELTKLAGLFASTAAGGEGASGGVKAVVQALFMAPESLHRTELGTDGTPGVVTQLTDHEVASALSYLIWDSAPDAELTALADQGKLHDHATLATQAGRLFATRDKAAPAMQHFFSQWLKLENLSATVKEPSLFPMATPDLVADLQQELDLFTSSVLFDTGGDRRFDSLFTANYAFVNGRTAPLYGLTGVTGDTLTRHELNPAERRGIFSMLPFLWGRSHSEDTNLVGRGAYVRAEVLCHRVPLPPGGVPNPGRFADTNATGRQRLGIHASPACAGCHSLFDGIGFALENYDAIGRYRTEEHGQPIDATGTLPLPSEGNALPGVPFSNFVDLVDELAAKPDVYSCFAQQFSAYASGRDLPELDACDRERIVEQFSGNNHEIDKLVLSVIASPSFLNRQN